ncbi:MULTISPECIES: SDR family NAD(P)-dependent oxidoreductase [Prochlorococcus]|uniref:SDR family NAD(P)-dependent oxidoreductase n=1 Tax=Prochlorococcus TaxID=1218 RepID=UPI000533972D|nr:MULTISPECIES: SDR family NAD(P)-dependent oxidoreductase [Prochlorococcus]KGG12597.1 Light-dependent protochlorophyllide reductase [Prochlorococcus sp. MIT 0601]
MQNENAIHLQENRTILITGGTSGIGYQSAIRMLCNGFRVILLCRNHLRIKETYEKFKFDIPDIDNYIDRLDLRLCDLSDLNSIKLFSEELLGEDCKIDTIVLNAGLQYTGAKAIRLSKQGIELTFAVNHVSHQYLIQKLFNLLVKSKSPRVVITSSEVHNPKLPGGRVGMPAGLGDLSGLKSMNDFLMVDGSEVFNADKAYKDSKLCNVLFAKELFSRIKQLGIKTPVICWAPGLVIPRSDNGFFRYSRKYNEIGQRVFAFIARDLLRITERPSVAGEILMNLSVDDHYSSPEFRFYSNKVNIFGENSFVLSDVSFEAKDTSKAKDLWNLTNKLIKLYCQFETI